MAGHGGSFQADGNGEEYDYELIYWTKEGDDTQYIDIEDSDMAYVQYGVFEIVGSGGEVSYETIYGPWEDWDFVEDTLEFDYGGEGSR